MNTLFEGHLVRLGPIDYEKDPEVLARWSRDPYLRFILGGVARPLSADAARKLLEAVEKKMDKIKNLFQFMLRARDDDHLVGIASIQLVDLTGISARLNLGVGELEDRERGYGMDALDLLLRFSFDELNLHRVAVFPASDNLPITSLVEKAGFELEVTRRKAAFHDGRFWDELELGLLKEKWERRL